MRSVLYVELQVFMRVTIYLYYCRVTKKIVATAIAYFSVFSGDSHNHDCYLEGDCFKGIDKSM